MCFGGGKSHQPQPQQAPAPKPDVTFDPNVAQRAQQQADRAAAIAQSDQQVSSTGSFGSELGSSAAIGTQQ
ncbi:MAG: hypothetical protein EB165_03570 [Euryarchaeota archaeon]|jgi:hypothetical protein|nr:hypothetical protein [Euryarchaeota archaeon]